jgi:FKBP-type peptidyl-prolyl cis-trans isomerase (trigger factor)
VRVAAAIVLVIVLAGCGGGETVARVGDEKISEEKVEQLVEHFEEEFAREGREFPAKGSAGYETVERQVLRLLVFRAQLEQAAAKLGIEVDEEEVEERLSQSEEAAEEGEGEEGEAYFENAMRIQLVREKVAAKLGGIEALNDWVAQARKEFPVEYEEGWEP